MIISDVALIISLLIASRADAFPFFSPLIPEDISVGVNQ